MSIIEILVMVLLVGLLFWGVRTIGAAFGIPAPFLQVLYVILVVACVLILLRNFGLIGGGPTLKLTP
jgi:hypothetical protein